MLVLRDSEDDNSTSGDYGFAGSQLEARAWVAQGPDGSVWALRWDQQTGGDAVEKFTYTSEGVVTISSQDGTAWIIDAKSEFGFRYLWRGGRDDGDGLLMMPGGGEHDTYRGAPMAEDAFAYRRYVSGGFFDAKHVEWTAVQEKSAQAATQSLFSNPVNRLTVSWDALWDPERYGAMSDVTQPAWINRTQGAFQVGFGILEGVTGIATSWTGFGLLAIVHGADTTGAGLYQLISGEQTPTLTSRAFAGAARLAGASEGTAQVVGVVGDMGVGFIAGFGSARGLAQAAQRQAIRQRVLANIAESRAAREASRFGLPRATRATANAAPSTAEMVMASACFVAGTQVLVADGPPLLAEMMRVDEETSESAVVAGKWDKATLFGSLACFAVAGVGFYYLWDSRRRRFLLDLKALQDEIEPLEMPLRFA
jgi:hypothetical protein